MGSRTIGVTVTGLLQQRILIEGMEELDIIIDFFISLGNGNYTKFKTLIMKGMTASLVTQIAALSEIHLLTNQWLNMPKSSQFGFWSCILVM
jgi:hypothetical protein